MKYTLLGAVSTLALGAAFGVGTPGAANAALTCTAGNVVGTGTCTETITFGPVKTDFTNATLTLDKWLSTASAGFTESLLDVKYSVGGTYNSSGTLTNTSASKQSFTFNTSETFQFSAGTGAPSNFLSGGLSANDSTATRYTLAASGGTAPYSVANKSLAGSSGSANTGLASYTGPGTFQADVTTVTGLGFAGGGNNITQNLTTTASPSVTITYDFTTAALPPPPPSPTVPEPASMALLGVGIAGLGAIRRRRKA